MQTPPLAGKLFIISTYVRGVAMLRKCVALVAVVVCAGVLAAGDDDPVREKLAAAKGRFDAEMKQVRAQVGEWFEKREEAARQGGDKQLVEQIKAARAEYDGDGDLPANVPQAIKEKQDKALVALAAAYTQAATDYRKAKKDEEAAGVEAELKNIRSRLLGLDRVREKLLAARKAYDDELKQFRLEVVAWLDKREEMARKDGDKKLVDQVKAERRAFSESEELPKMLPAAIAQKPARARKALEAAHELAVKHLTMVKQDEEAVVVEKALLAFRKEFWKNVDSTKATFKDDYLRLPPRTELPTVQKFAGGFEIVLVARTESEDIRLWAQRGAAVIFNWELNPRELRVTRPDGSDQRESGSLATSKVTPLKPNTWYTLKWRVTEEGMQISVDGKVVFSEQKRYELTETAPIVVRSEKSAVDVKELRVTSLGKAK